VWVAERKKLHASERQISQEFMFADMQCNYVSMVCERRAANHQPFVETFYRSHVQASFHGAINTDVRERLRGYLFRDLPHLLKITMAL
jgi:hypothetical protein